MKLFGGRIGVRKKWVRVLTIILALISTGVISGYAWWKINIIPPEIPEISERDMLSSIELPSRAADKAQRLEDDDECAAAIDRNQRKPGVYTFAFLGKENDGNTDTIMVGMLDTENEAFSIVSIPRDTMVNVSRSVKKINAAYGLGELTGRGNGIPQVKGELETLIGFRPDFYILANYRGFIRLVDTMGGVDFNVPTNMYKITDDMIIDLQKGQQRLSGYQALQMVRFRDYTGREGFGNDDFGRMAVQQAFLKAMGKQAVSLGNLFKLGEFLRIAEENLITDLSGTSMTWLATTVLGYGVECLSFYTLPTGSVRYNRGWYEHVLVDEALELINRTINPFVREITAEDLDIRKISD
jgi:LCP family protein required for cell wall assembly